MIQTRLYCFCGVDGAGKSSIVNELEYREMVPGAIFLRRAKEPDSSSEFLRKFSPREFNDGRDWISGDFSEAIGSSLLFEFIEHYKNSIEPLLGKVETIICDRYALCFEAYLLGINYGVNFSSIFDQLMVPTELFYVHLPESELMRRYHIRGGVQDDENLEVMRKFDWGYRQLLPTRCPTHTFVDNSGAFEYTLDFVANKLWEIM